MRAIMRALGFGWPAVTKTYALAITTAILNAVLLYMVGSAERLPTVQLTSAAAVLVFTVAIFAVAQRALASLLAGQSECAQGTIRLDLLSWLQQIRHAEFEQLNESEVRTLVTHDAVIVAQFWPTLVSLFVSSVTVTLCVAYLAWTNPWQLLALSLGMTATLALYAAETARLPLLFKRSRDSYAKFSEKVTEMLDGAKELKLDRRRRVSDFWPQLQALSDQHRDESAAAHRKGMMAGATGSATFFLLIGAAVLLSHLTSHEGAQSSAQLVIVLLYLSGPINKIVNNLPAYGGAASAARRIEAARAFLRNAREPDAAALPPGEAETGRKPGHATEHGPVPGNAGGREVQADTCPLPPILRDWRTLRFDKVEYHYPAADRPGAKFGPVSFTIQRGEITLVVGPNGAGKSTAGKLLTGLYQPTRGAILLDGQAVSVLPPDDYRQMFSAIYSDFHLFDNLMRPDHSLDRFERLLDEFRLPRALLVDRSRDSLRRLSDGQRRRLALLMGLIEDKPIYFFDEWASDQDPEFRAYFYNDVMQRLRQAGKTVVAITHDDTYFGVADHLVRIEGQARAGSGLPIPA